METLNVKTRNITGKKVRILRKKGEIPAVLYGYGIESEALVVPVKDFEKIFKKSGETSLLSLVVDDSSSNTRTVLIRDVQRDSLSRLPLHVDFHQVNMNEELDLDAPLVFTGTSMAVSSEGGVLVKALYELPISALPANLPHELSIDITPLEKIGDAIHVKDIKFPTGVRVRLDEDATIVFIDKPISEEDLAALEAAPEVKVEEIEVVGEKEKKEAEEAEVALAAAEKEKKE